MTTDFHSPAVSWQEPRSFAHGGSGFSLMGLLAAWYARGCQRQELGLLNDHMLADIGLTRDDVEFESNKPFWMS